MYILTITREGYANIEQKTGFQTYVKAFNDKQSLFDEIEKQILDKHCSVAGWRDPVFREKVVTTGAFSTKDGWVRIFRPSGSLTYIISAHKVVMPGWTESVRLNDRLTVVCWESGLTNYDVEMEKLEKEAENALSQIK